MRASDADREDAADALRRHHAAGRIDDDELEERVAVVLTARTVADIEAQFADLPRASTDLAPAVPADIEIGGYGMRKFRQRHLLRCARDVAWRQVMADIAPSLSAYGYTVVDRHEPDYVVFELRERSAWDAFSFGSNENATRVVIALAEPTPGTTELVASGAARRPVRKAFAQISAPG